MKVLVDEISLEQLNNVKNYFVSDEEIKILEYCDKSAAYYECENPFYIEESIKDIDRVLKLCEDVSYNSSIMKKIKWDDFDKFWWLILEIKKQRDIGIKTGDIEYVYAMTKDIVPVTLTDTEKLNRGFTFETPHLVVYGKSKLGEMMLYKDIEDMSDFVFFVEFMKRGLFGKKYKEYSHYHPQNYEEAIKGVIDWMTNSREFIDKFKIAIEDN